MSYRFFALEDAGGTELDDAAAELLALISGVAELCGAMAATPRQPAPQAAHVIPKIAIGSTMKNRKSPQKTPPATPFCGGGGGYPCGGYP